MWIFLVFIFHGLTNDGCHYRFLYQLGKGSFNAKALEKTVNTLLLLEDFFWRCVRTCIHGCMHDIIDMPFFLTFGLGFRDFRFSSVDVYANLSFEGIIQVGK